MIYAYVAIGNTDNKLTQQEWAEFVNRVRLLVMYWGKQTHGEWHSLPDKPWQNACWGFDIEVDRIPGLQGKLANAAADYRQDSIAWMHGGTTFITPSTGGQHE